MAGVVKATSPQIQALGNLAVSTGEQIARQVTTIMGIVEEHAQAGFRGRAGNALQVAQENIGQDLRKLLDDLNSLGQAANASNTHYGTSDEDAGAEIAKVAGGGQFGNVAQSLRG